MPLDNTNPEITILVPIYNVSKYLQDCLASIERQSFVDFEVLCLNDGSTDDSATIIASFVEKDPRFKLVSKPNTGYGDTLNKGLEAAAGKYIAILESDDEYAQDALRILHDAATRHRAQVAKADFNLWWSSEDVKERFGWTGDALQGVCNPQVEPEVFFRKPSIWSALYEKAFLDENNIRFLPTPGASYQDAAFNFKVWASCTRCSLVNKPIVDYRQDNEASSVKSPEKMLCVRDEYSEMITWLDESGRYDERFKAILTRMRYDTYLWNYDRLDESLRPVWLEYMRTDFMLEDGNGASNSCYFDPEAWSYRTLMIENPKLFESMQSIKLDNTTSKLDTFKTYLANEGATQTLRAYAYRISRI